MRQYISVLHIQYSLRFTCIFYHCCCFNGVSGTEIFLATQMTQTSCFTSDASLDLECIPSDSNPNHRGLIRATLFGNTGFQLNSP